MILVKIDLGYNITLIYSLINSNFLYVDSSVKICRTHGLLAVQKVYGVIFLVCWMFWAHVTWPGNNSSLKSNILILKDECQDHVLCVYYGFHSDPYWKFTTNSNKHIQFGILNLNFGKQQRNIFIERIPKISPDYRKRTQLSVGP